jgi:hypothetical protein
VVESRDVSKEPPLLVIKYFKKKGSDLGKQKIVDDDVNALNVCYEFLKPYFCSTYPVNFDIPKQGK